MYRRFLSTTTTALTKPPSPSSSTPTPRTWTVPTTEANSRLDRYLRRTTPSLTQSLIQKLLRHNKILLNNHPATLASHRVQPDDLITLPSNLTLPPPKTPPPKPPLTPHQHKTLQTQILYSDKNHLILNKPPDQTTQGAHPLTPRTKTLTHYLPHLIPTTPTQKPHIIHRLDHAVSGAILLAKNLPTAQYLSKLFRERSTSIKKVYWGLVYGRPEKKEGRVVWDVDGRRCESLYRVVESMGDVMSWLELVPVSGRKHQLRIHCAEGLGCGIVGDWKYGGDGDEGKGGEMVRAVEGFLGSERGKGICLHCRTLGFQKMGKGREWVQVEAPLPEHMKRVFRQCNFGQPD